MPAPVWTFAKWTVNVVASRFRAPWGLFAVMLAMARFGSKFAAPGFDDVVAPVFALRYWTVTWLGLLNEAMLTGRSNVTVKLLRLVAPLAPEVPEMIRGPDAMVARAS